MFPKHSRRELQLSQGKTDTLKRADSKQVDKVDVVKSISKVFNETQLSDSAFKTGLMHFTITHARVSTDLEICTFVRFYSKQQPPQTTATLNSRPLNTHTQKSWFAPLSKWGYIHKHHHARTLSSPSQIKQWINRRGGKSVYRKPKYTGPISLAYF